MISGIFLLFLVLLFGNRSYSTEACSANFTNLRGFVFVDRSTSIGEVIYTLQNGNDARSIVMETSPSGSYGLNPGNNHEVIVTACVVNKNIEILRFMMAGDLIWCGNLAIIPLLTIPQFTNPTEIIKIGAISHRIAFVDVVQITFATQCGDFDCSNVTCTNDPNQKFAYFADTQMIRVVNSFLQYSVTYTVNVTCSDSLSLSSKPNTQTLNVVFYETAPTGTITTISTTTASTFPSTNPLRRTSTLTLPTTFTTRSISTTTTPLLTTATSPTTMTTTPDTTTTPSTTLTMPLTIMTTLSTTTARPSSTTITLTTTKTVPSATRTKPTTTTITPSTTMITPSTTTTTPSTTTTTPLLTTATSPTTMTTTPDTTTTPSTTLTMPLHCMKRLFY